MQEKPSLPWITGKAVFDIFATKFNGKAHTSEITHYLRENYQLDRAQLKHLSIECLLKRYRAYGLLNYKYDHTKSGVLFELTAEGRQFVDRNLVEKLVQVGV